MLEAFPVLAAACGMDAARVPRGQMAELVAYLCLRDYERGMERVSEVAAMGAALRTR